MTRVRHRLFGKLAVATGFLSEAQLNEALDVQQKARIQGEDVPKLGEILEDKGYLTRRQVQTILKKARKMGGRRFGEIAMNLHFITLEQLNVARNVQEKLEHPERDISLSGSTRVVHKRLRERTLEEGSSPPIGEILLELGFLSKEQFEGVLEQRNRTTGTCPRCQSRLNLTSLDSNDRFYCPRCSASLLVHASDESRSITLAGVSRSDDHSLQRVDQQEGTTFGDYQFIEEVGRDATGILYRGRQTSRGREVALKALFNQDSMNPDSFSHLKEQVRKRTTLNHSAVRHLERFITDAPVPFLVLEWVDGKSVRIILKNGHVFSENRSVQIIRQIVDGLTAGRNVDLYHGDLRPSNLLILPSNQVKLLNLGMTLRPSEQLFMVMDSGERAPFYQAPELVLEDRSVSVQSDIYSLGACFYHMVTGDPPLSGTAPYEVVRNALEEGVTDPVEKNPDLTRDRADVILQMMNVEPDERFDSHDELLTALDEPA